VERMFPDTRVAKFSAFARIVKSGSEALRALVSASSVHTDGANDTFDLKWATENLIEKRFAQMTRVLRNTRHRAIEAETRLRMVDERLAVLTSRVTSSAPVYDEIVEVEVSQRTDPRTGFMVAGSPVSFTVMMDKAVTFRKCGLSGGSMRMGPLVTPPTIEMKVEYGYPMSDITQVIAPMVRPVYGDVIAVPAHFQGFTSCGASGTDTNLVIYAGNDVGGKYAHKVGEVKRGQVAALIAALRGKSDCNWRRK
jgi:hypothetical protein